MKPLKQLLAERGGKEIIPFSLVILSRLKKSLYKDETKSSCPVFSPSYPSYKQPLNDFIGRNILEKKNQGTHISP